MASQFSWCSQKGCLCQGSVAPQILAIAEEVSVWVICGVAGLLASAEEVSV